MHARGCRQILDAPRAVGDNVDGAKLRRDVDDLCTGVVSDHLQQGAGGRDGILSHRVSSQPTAWPIPSV